VWPQRSLWDFNDIKQLSGAGDANRFGWSDSNIWFRLDLGYEVPVELLVWIKTNDLELFLSSIFDFDDDEATESVGEGTTYLRGTFKLGQVELEIVLIALRLYRSAESVNRFECPIF